MTLIPQMTSNISIIIPTLNEEHTLPSLHWLPDMVRECIVVDGGSRDDTVRVAHDLGFVVKRCTGGRGAQLNLGTAAASAPLLLFLHADTQLPSDFAHAVTQCLANPATAVGSFRLVVNKEGMAMRMITQGANLRSRFLQLPYGDQALFLRKETFDELGGFPELPIMEDYIFIRKAKKKGRVVTLPQAVTTSGRRWQQLGPIRTTMVNQLILCAYHLGVPAEKLASFYRSGLFFGKFRGNKGTNKIL